MTDSADSVATTRNLVRYSDNVEDPKPDEDEVIDKIVERLHRNNVRAFKIYKHAIRDAHAKSHGVLRGELTVDPDLAVHLRQGMFATPTTYPVIARLSSTPGMIRSDQVPGVRAIALKVFGVHGPRARDDGNTTQDYVMVNHPQFPTADAHAYLKRGMPFNDFLVRTPDRAIRLIAGSLRGPAWLIKRFGLSLPALVALFTEPNNYILGQTFHTAAPVRYGDYVAKISVAPLSTSVKQFVDRAVPRSGGDDAQRDTVGDFFRNNSAEYEVRAQLCEAPIGDKIEDATVVWPERQERIATITFPAQNADGLWRRVYADDVLSFNSWNTLEAHRPLGSINRLKLKVYNASSEYRHAMNKAPSKEPASIDELPD